MKKVDMQTYRADPARYELRSGDQPDAPRCPYGNAYQWIGYDLVERAYVRFTTSVFKLLIARHEAT
ncbi:MAG: hypothetical protein RhofKO_30830 [Rhodothermales bacterium]